MTKFQTGFFMHWAETTEILGRAEKFQTGGGYNKYTNTVTFFTQLNINELWVELSQDVFWIVSNICFREMEDCEESELNLKDDSITCTLEFFLQTLSKCCTVMHCFRRFSEAKTKSWTNSREKMLMTKVGPANMGEIRNGEIITAPMNWSPILIGKIWFASSSKMFGKTISEQNWKKRT